MFKINSYTDLKVAYEILETAYNSGMSEMVAALKREIRAFLHRPSLGRRIIRDDGMDGYVELLQLPECIETMDEAVDYFEGYEYRPYYAYDYDCTGQTFTNWYKVFRRRGRFWAYHSVMVDV